ncbi:hypothetical protein INT45_003622 [Circinella minor]|uniref:Uncharacterized protein n=1 Tax=Circinella minor TaxID=1195481 RepID=A0A8H7UZJ8_9FUNG|nr:hypothetical protein INT45_003622 [Circinella minor]
MLDELKTLQNEGFHVQGDDGKIYHARAHLLQGNVWLEESKKMAKTVPEIQSTGDIPAASKLMLHKGHMSRREVDFISWNVLQTQTLPYSKTKAI